MTDQKRLEKINLLTFYDIARRANLTTHPDLVNLPVFQEARKLFEDRLQYMKEGFGDQKAIDDYFKFHFEGALAEQNKTWEDLWSEFAPPSLKKFPLPPGVL